MGRARYSRDLLIRKRRRDKVPALKRRGRLFTPIDHVLIHKEPIRSSAGKVRKVGIRLARVRIDEIIGQFAFGIGNGILVTGPARDRQLMDADFEPRFAGVHARGAPGGAHHVVCGHGEKRGWGDDRCAGIIFERNEGSISRTGGQQRGKTVVPDQSHSAGIVSGGGGDGDSIAVKFERDRAYIGRSRADIGDFRHES